jgi:filamentous hemagglutinin
MLCGGYGEAVADSMIGNAGAFVVEARIGEAAGRGAATGVRAAAGAASITIEGITGGLVKLSQMQAVRVAEAYAKQVIGKTDLGVPKFGSLTDTEARAWYLQQEAKIPSLLDPNASLAQQAQQAGAIRNEIRTTARDAMENRAGAAKITSEKPNLTWEQTVEKYKFDEAKTIQRTPAQIYQEIIAASQRSNSAVNEMLGIRPPGG